jgi:hypothetical protein
MALAQFGAFQAQQFDERAVNVAEAEQTKIEDSWSHWFAGV